MNIQFLHGYGQRSFWMLLLNVFVVATPEYRPAGGVVYRALYGALGLNPIGFRIFCYALLVFNLGLAEEFLFALTRSRRVSMFGVLVFAFHVLMAELYFNTGTLYDILCFSFGIASLIWYLRVRQAGKLPSVAAACGIIALYCLALEFKEMAIMWPVVFVIYEGVFHRNLHDFRKRIMVPGIAAAITILFALVKTRVPSQMSINSLYQPRASAAFIIGQARHYYAMGLPSGDLTPAALGVGVAIALATALWLRNRGMVFGMLFALVTLVPVLVIPDRAGFVWYIPWLGWALYGASLLSVLLAKIPGTSEFSYREVAILFCLAAGLFVWQRVPASQMGALFADEQHRLRSMLDAQLMVRPSLPKGSRILVAEDRYSDVAWSPLFLMRLAYHDASIWVDRIPQMGAAYDAGDLSAYQTVIYAGKDPVRVVAVTQPESASPVLMRVVPDTVDRGLVVKVSLPEHASCPVDVEYRMPEDELARSGIWKNWTTLDASGAGSVRIGQDAERGLVQIERVRFCHQGWLPAAGSFTIIP